MWDSSYLIENLKSGCSETHHNGVAKIKLGKLFEFVGKSGEFGIDNELLYGV